MDVEAACTFANRFLSSHSPPIGGQSTMGPPNTRNRSQHAATTVNATSRSDLREQSIIPPWEFYGLGSSRHLPQRNQPEPTPRPSSPPKGVKAANFADLGQVDASLDVENEATEDFGTDDPATHEASGALPDFEDEGGESGLLVSSPPKLDRVLPLRELSANERIRRHQSMPARINRNVEGHIERGSLGDTSGLGSLEEEIARVRLADRAVPTVRTGVPEPPRRKSKKKCVAERKIIEPGLSRHVPLHQRKSDAELLQIARLIAPYQRHRRAPYAFSYLGRLYAEYKHLRVAVDYNDRLILTAQELSRL